MTKSQLYTFLLTYQQENSSGRAWIERALSKFPNVLKTLRINLGDEFGTIEVYQFLKPQEGLCQLCSKPTKFRSFSSGFKKFCSTQCANERNFGPKEELNLEPKVKVEGFDDIVDPSVVPKEKVEKPNKKVVSAVVEKPPVSIEKTVLKNSGGTMYDPPKKPTIAPELEQPRVRLLADLKQFGIRRSNPPKRITQGHWDRIKESEELVARSEAELQDRKAKREARKEELKVEPQIDPIKNDKVEIHGDRTFELQGMESNALSVLLYEMGIPVHLFDTSRKEVSYFNKAIGKQKNYVPNLVLDNKIVIMAKGPSALKNERLVQEIRDKCTGVIWSGRHFLLLVMDNYGNILSANVDQVSDMETTPLSKEAVLQLAGMIRELLNR